MNRLRPLPWITLAMALAACSSHETTSATSAQSTASASSSSGAGGGGGGGGAGLVYGSCPKGYLSECATIQVPLDHNAKGETIDFHFARYPAPMQPAKRQVWLLAGGPGQAGYVFGSRVEALSAAMPDADIFAPDHRGTGYSHRLSCPQEDVANSYGGYSLQPSQAQACLASLKPSGDYDKLAYFTSAQAAADVLDGIAAARTSPDEKVYVMGASYGTHWAHRIVQLDPNALDGVIFDGFLTPNEFSFLDYDRGAEEAGEGFANACDLDASCTSHVGPGGGLNKIKTVLANLATTPCGPFDKAQTRKLITLLMDPWFGRALIFPAIHRLERCSTDDQTAVAMMVNTFNAALLMSYDVPYVNSGVLQNNIVLSELWAKPGEVAPSKSALIAAADAQTFLPGASLPGGIIDMRAFWPLPPNDYANLAVPVVTSTKMLWLGAEFDVHAYPSQAQKIATIYPAAPYLSLKAASHTPGSQSPLTADHKTQCGQLIINAFIEGDGAVDTSCESGMLTPMFEAPDGAFAMKYFGTADDWGDGTPKPILPPAAPPPEISVDPARWSQVEISQLSALANAAAQSARALRLP